MALPPPVLRGNDSDSVTGQGFEIWIFCVSGLFLHLEAGTSVVSFKAFAIRGTQLVKARNSTQFRDRKGFKSHNMSHLNPAGLTSFRGWVVHEYPGGWWLNAEWTSVALQSKQILLFFTFPKPVQSLVLKVCRKGWGSSSQLLLTGATCVLLCGQTPHMWGPPQASPWTLVLYHAAEELPRSRQGNRAISD